MCSKCTNPPQDGISFIQKMTGMSFPDIVNTIGDNFNHLDHNEIQKVQDNISQEKQKKWERNKISMREAWKRSKPFAKGDSASSYFEERGIELPVTNQMRLVRKLDYYEKPPGLPPEKVGEYDAILSLMTKRLGDIVGMHITYIEDGKKAPVRNPKKMKNWGEVEGCSIKMNDLNGKIVCVGEGIETALKYGQAFGIPAWACVSNSVLETFPGVDTETGIVILGDHDASKLEVGVYPTGQISAWKLHAKLNAKGIPVKIDIPPVVGDWDDYLPNRSYQEMGGIMGITPKWLPEASRAV